MLQLQLNSSPPASLLTSLLPDALNGRRPDTYFRSKVSDPFLGWVRGHKGVSGQLLRQAGVFEAQESLERSEQLRVLSVSAHTCVCVCVCVWESSGCHWICQNWFQSTYVARIKELL